MNYESRKTPLADVAHETAAHARGLDWVGMEGIALPLRRDGATVPAMADVFVDLVAGTRGIHMSRLYLRLRESLANGEVGIARVRAFLQACIDSQQGLSTAARLRLRFSALLERPALASANAGWRDYPVEVEAQLGRDGLQVAFTVDLQYSSTCPASAALSRQVISEHFLQAFPDGGSAAEIAAWLESPAGMAATPHAQRSIARVRVELAEDADEFPVAALVDAVERALGTPVQTAVKREDERAFAEANAANLMFCEDAARRVAAAVSTLEACRHYRVQVSHLESLHAHDAVAVVSA
ncbi:GTP cyclohydrolase FolE2 [Solilutibacter silvestris]|uniref:GTP cyclohydrolase FolE2 n=1 Tax=Solilutibacter silvestris TaxID=1645665 RepID=UPI003D34D710